MMHPTAVYMICSLIYVLIAPLIQTFGEIILMPLTEGGYGMEKLNGIVL